MTSKGEMDLSEIEVYRGLSIMASIVHMDTTCRISIRTATHDGGVGPVSMDGEFSLAEGSFNCALHMMAQARAQIDKSLDR
jgi:hypothetical protein